MASSVIKNSGIYRGRVNYSYSMGANGNANTNLKTLIDANVPSGYECIGICGYATNSVYVQVCNCYYSDSPYSLQLSNRANSTQAETCAIFYLAMPMQILAE